MKESANDSLSENGNVTMPLQQTFWASRFVYGPFWNSMDD